MLKKVLLTVVLMTVVSHAAVKELLPKLTADNLETQTQARLDLLAICSRASAPDAPPDDRQAVCLEICDILTDSGQPVVTVVQPLLNNLERIGGEESVPTLVKLLSHRDEHICDDARRALAVNPSAAAGQALAAQLRMRRMRPPRMTAGLIYALGERGETGASELIAGHLNSRDDEVYIAAVKALGMLNEDDGIRALAAQRTKVKGFRKLQVEAALFSSGRKVVFEKLYADNETEEVRATALLGLAINGGINVAAEAMDSGSPALQTAVIEGALQSGNRQLYDIVAGRISALPPYLQLRAVAALEFSGDTAYAKAVEPLLESPDIRIQDNAAAALARIGTSRSAAVLIANGRPAARRALGLLDVTGIDKVLEREARTAGDNNRRSVAIEALAIRGRRDLIPVFYTYAAEDVGVASVAAADAIGQLGELQDVDKLAGLMIKMEESPVSRNLLTAIVNIMRRATEPAEALDLLVKQMDGASPRSQANLLQAMVRAERKEALKPLSDACRSSDPQLQKTAVKLLAGWKKDNALPTMIELAGEDALPLPDHVTIMRGISRLLAGQRRLNMEQANQALEICRREEDRQMIQAVIDKKSK